MIWLTVRVDWPVTFQSRYAKLPILAIFHLVSDLYPQTVGVRGANCDFFFFNVTYHSLQHICKLNCTFSCKKLKMSLNKREEEIRWRWGGSWPTWTSASPRLSDKPEAEAWSPSLGTDWGLFDAAFVPNRKEGGWRLKGPPSRCPKTSLQQKAETKEKFLLRSHDWRKMLNREKFKTNKQTNPQTLFKNK